MYILVGKFIVEVPQTELGFWKIVEQFEEETEAKRYADRRFGSVNGVFNSLEFGLNREKKAVKES